jgi:hypothetical protein
MSSRCIALIAAVAGLALVPGAASAHSGSPGERHHHHHRHHVRGHHHHHARVKVITSRDPASGAYTDPNGPATSGQVTIASFSGGKLTLQLADGTTTGRVTDKTTIRCATPPQGTTTAAARGDDGPGDDQSGDDGPGDDGGNRGSGDDDGGGGDRGSGDDDGAGAGDQAGTCDQSALVAGAMVSRAKLRISGGVATFQQIEIAGPAS